MANLHSPSLRKVWDLHQKGENATDEQEFIISKKIRMDPYRPLPATVKTLLHVLHNLPDWSVRPPLTPLSNSAVDRLLQDMVD
jgi:dihydrodipicolinate synthase/N-acetylneuraminate lyase